MRLKFTRLLARILLIVGVLAGVSSAAVANVVTRNGVSLETNLPQAQRGVFYSYQLTPSPTGTYSFSELAGALPQGITLSPSGLVSGLYCGANVNGSFGINLRVSGSSIAAPGYADFANAQNKGISLNMTAGPANGGACATLGIIPNPTSITGTVGVAITAQTNTASGGTGPYTWSSPNLPAGLSIDPSTGTVTGTPTGPASTGSFYTVTVTDANGATASVDVPYTINLGAQAPLTVQISASSTNGTGAGNAATLSTTGGSGTGQVTYNLEGGDCTLVGTTVYANTTPTTCVVTATKAGDADYNPVDSVNSVSYAASATLTLVDPPISLGPSTTISSGSTQVVTVSNIPTGSEAAPYNVPATGTVSFSVSGPCSVSPTSVTLGSPVVQPSTTVTSTGSGGTCTVTANYSGDGYYLPSTANAIITVTAPPAENLVLGPANLNLPAAQVGVNYVTFFTSTGGTGAKFYEVRSGSLPPGLTLDPNTGRLSGNPSTANTYSFQICVVDSATPTADEDCKTYSLTVAAGFGISTNSLPAPTLGANYTQPIAVQNALGAVTYAITAGALPAGLALNTSTGEITGIPQTGGCYTFTVTATDSGRVAPNNTSSRVYTVCITRPDPSQDANVRGIISSQARAAYRFVRGQIALIQSHLDSMHDDDDSGDGCSDPDRPGAVQDFCVEYDNKLQINGAQRPLSGQEQDVQNLRRLNDVNAMADPNGVSTQSQNQNQRLTQNQIQGQPKVGSVESLLGNTQDGKLASDPTVREFFALGAERSSNYPPRTAGQTAEVVGPTPKIKGGVKVNVWTAGQIDFGRYDNQGRLLNEKFNVGSVAVGADMRVIPGLRAGVAFGYGNDYATINYGLAQSTAQNFSGTAYASYRVMPGLFLDALAGYGDLNYTSSRLSGNGRDWLTGNRSGYAFYESLALTLEKRYGALKFAPYLRVDGAQVNLNQYSEVGNYDWALSYAAAQSTTVDAVAGVRASYDYKLINGGVITPNARAQFQKFFTGSLNQFMNYSIDPTINYGYLDQGQLQWMFMGTIGAQYTFGNISAGVDYITTTSGARYQTNGMRGNIRVSF